VAALNYRRRSSLTVCLLGGLLLAGCASQPTEGPAYDPLEDANRTVYGFNETVDTYALAPTARGWTAITTPEMRRGVGNFFSNLSYPGVAINNLLQGKPELATRDTIRFMVNSTLGIGGLFDPATAMGLKKHNEDLGQTLAVWGVDSGPFLMLPLLGPSNVRDTSQYPASAYTDVLYYVSWDALATGGLSVLNVVNTRAQLDRAVAIRDQAALDPYAFTRSSYRQLRRNRIHDGNPPKEEDPYGDFFNEYEAGGSGANGAGADTDTAP